MSDIDAAFCRTMLKEAHTLVKKHYPHINLTKAAWTYKVGRDHWEFHGPGSYYWHGSAANAYDARYHGWMAWLASKGHVEE